ncbi:MAG: leucine-rich repeat protein [Ruminococcus sp.]|uniref:leucine-rich repeat protein n=1 Tax=Ruminococcus sp. TaxID=41978 RepID=UPI0025DF1553|nr:leucine-rich repeat protein [Ruminococcus sp.]MBR0530579.1 leucine-rich repeat protein [Ruminococcus sp.]
MKKKIMASVAALLMTASCVPANTVFNFSPAATITASAATKETIGDGNVDVTIENDGTITLTPKDIFTYFGMAESKADLHINMSGLKPELTAIAGSLEGRKIIMNAPSKALRSYPNLSHIYFEDDIINAVGSNFASSCPHLQTVSLGSAITEIGNNAFSGCSILQGTTETNMDLTNIITIGDSAFSGCKEINAYTFGGNLRHIGKSAFNSNTTLVNVDLPASVAEIDDNAFSGCTSLETVEFSSNDTLVLLGNSAFSNCEKLVRISVKGLNYNTLPAGNMELKIGTNGMFNNCRSLQNFTWPDPGMWIPANCFNSCTSLKTFNFGTGPANSRCEKILTGAFSNCSSLVSIELPDANTVIDASAFYGCTKLEKVVVSDQLSNVGASAFKGCTVLSLYPRSDTAKTKNKVVLPSTWQELSAETFRGCTGLTHADISPVTKMGDYVFESCTSLLDIAVPDAITAIPKYTFQNCKSLKDVVVSRDLGTVYDYAFQNCISLETLTPSNASKLAYTFQFPASLGGVQQCGFQKCSAFKYINFTDDSQFAVVGKSSFSECTSLLGSNVGGNANDTISMPKGVKVIQDSAFRGDTSLDKITFLGEVSTVDTSAFEKCTNLEEVIMNDTITQVGQSAFRECTSLKKMPTTPSGQTAFSNITIIQNSTFDGCTALEDAFIPKNVAQIGQNAFSRCTALTSVKWEEGSELSEIGSYAFANCSALERFSSADSGDVSTFPGSLLRIKDSAFSDDALKNIVIGTPDDGSTIFIGNNAFTKNIALETADLSGSNIIEIPSGCFQNCENLKTCLVPKDTVVKVGDNAFNGCYYLHTLGTPEDATGEYTIPESMTLIAGNAFTNNYCMQVINFPASATSLNLSMFNISLREDEIEKKGYTPLEAINVDENNPNYKSVDGVLFNKDITTLLCRPVRMKNDSYTIPDTVDTIGASACAANIFLKNVILTDNVKTIGDKAFNDCHSLESVDFGSNGTVELGNNVFYRSGGKITLYGTEGSTAQTYAEKNTSYVIFVDNAKVAAALSFQNDSGIDLKNKVTIAKKIGSYKLVCKQTAADGSEAADTLKWSVDKPEIATINNDGQLYIKDMGTVVVTVQNANGTVSNSITIVINETGISDDIGILGDVNGDGKVNVTDISKVAAHVKGIKKLDANFAAAADVNLDGKVNVTDISKIAAQVKGIKKI